MMARYRVWASKNVKKAYAIDIVMILMAAGIIANWLGAVGRH